MANIITNKLRLNYKSVVITGCFANEVLYAR